MIRRTALALVSAAAVAGLTIPATAGADTGQIHCQFQRQEVRENPVGTPMHDYWADKLRDCLAAEDGH